MLGRYLLKTAALPPAINILIILAALLLLRSKPKLRNTLILLSTLSLAFLATPFAAQLLARQLEIYPALDVEKIDTGSYQAIVILGAGRHRQAPEYGGADVPKAMGLERLRYGMWLQRKTGLPIMVAGGQWGADTTPESDFMASIVEREFMGVVTWRESSSRTTWENANFAKVIADKNNLRRVLLVTQAWHMPRAMYSFEQAGFSVTAAPTGFRSDDQEGMEVADYLPQANALYISTLMLHEMLGLLWYRLIPQ